jgi:hypothetical protein
MVERQLPKLHTRVRFPSPAPAFAPSELRLGKPVCAKAAAPKLRSNEGGLKFPSFDWQAKLLKKFVCKNK